MDFKPGTPSAYVLAIILLTFVVMVGAGLFGALVGQLVQGMGYEIDPRRWGAVSSLVCSVATFLIGSVASYWDFHIDRH